VFTTLIEKLKAACFTGEALALFKSYLSNRGQSVQINGKSSSKRTILAGIAQGSFSELHLFLIFINDIFNIPLLGKIQLYADDAVLMYAVGDHHTIICQMKSDLMTLYNWFGLNYIKMNVLKTNFILFKGDEQTELTIEFAETTITEAKSTKFLGLQIDKHLKCVGRTFEPCQEKDFTNDFRFEKDQILHIGKSRISTILCVYIFAC
jgi:hypothetical protein